MPKLAFLGHLGYIDRIRDRVINAFAAECGLPLTGGDEAYPHSELRESSEKHKTNVRFVGQDCYDGSLLIGFDTTSEAKLLEEIRVKNGID